MKSLLWVVRFDLLRHSATSTQQPSLSMQIVD